MNIIKTLLAVIQLNKITLVFGLMIFTFGSLMAQELLITPPNTSDKSVIYFVRTGGTGAWINFRFFDNDKYLGKLSGKDFIRYECDPGEKIFWVKAENVDFVEANLEAGKTYLVEVRPIPGVFVSGVKYRLVDFSDEKQITRINNVLAENNGVYFTDQEIEESPEDMKDVIKSGLLKFERKKQRGKKIKRIASNMSYTNGE